MDEDEAASAAAEETEQQQQPSVEETEALRVAQAQAIMESLSRLERTLDDSGYAFTAVDAVDKALVSLEALRGYPHIQFVNVSQNQLTDVSPLGDLPYLVCANLSENAIATPPLALASNAYLQSLDLSLNQLTTLQGLTSTSLSSLRIHDNQLENLIGIAGVPSLTILEAARNSIADLSALTNESFPSKLELLDLNENKLTSLDGVEVLTTLHSLSVRQNNLDSMDAIATLSALTQLSELDLLLNPLVDSDSYRLSMIIQLPQLQKLDGELISDDERLAAVELKQQQLADAAATAAAAADE